MPSPPLAPLQPDQDLFDDALHLEDDFYAEGYELGVVDGRRAGQTEGRAFGWEKGFEKGVAMGRLAGQAAVWQSRLTNATTDPSLSIDDKATGERDPMNKLRPLRRTERLQRQVARLRETTNFPSLPVRNTELAVDEFDDKLRDAQARATMITTATGEGNRSTDTDHDNRNIYEQNGERSARPRGFRLKKPATTTSNAEMEDFAGLPRAPNRRGAAP